ncbi:MAG: nitrate reductase associated protein [Chitinophagaceae bacterium]
MKHNAGPSEFKGLHGIEYFQFEEDFIEKNVRCIPMIVRFKMDAAGIKLKLAEWSKFSTEERVELALKPCINEVDVEAYKKYLADLIINRTGKEATTMEVDKCPVWAMLYELPGILIEKANEFGNGISLDQWASLTDLQRFALLKLCREGHENKNFPKAFREFGLLD